MDNPEVIDTAWVMLDHACRSCGGRVLASADGASARVRCAECSAEAAGGPTEICWCGALPAGSRARLKCVRSSGATPEFPCQIVAIECGEDAAAQPAVVEYLQVDGCNKRFFRCQALRSTLSVEGCAGNWRRAQRISAEELGFSGKCRDCPIGALHAGARHVHRSRLFGAQICPRSRRWASRLIGNRLGISAWNREREVRIGRNAKNTRPQLVLEPRRLGVIVSFGSPDQRHVELRDELTADTLELAVQVLRVATGRIAFCRPRGGPSITTADLARQMGVGREMARGIIAHPVKPRPRHRLAPIDRLPNEHRDQPRPGVLDGGAVLARNLGIGAVA
jgi:hypothetical protein